MDLVALVTLVGGLSYRQFVLVPLYRDLPGDADRSFRLLMAVSLLMLGATSTADLIFRTLMMSGRPFSELFSVLPTVLLQTHFGRVWVWRAGLLLLLFGFWFLQRGPRPRIRGYLVLFVGSGVCLTTSLSGHAADLGSLTITVFVDWIHVMAVSSWVGGLFFMRFHLSGRLTFLEGNTRARCLTAGIERFSTVAMTAVGALIATGLYNTWVHVHSPALLVGTSYGKILILKWSFLLPMLLLGAVSRYGILPLLQAQGGKTKESFLTRMISGWIKRVGDRFQICPPPVLELEQWFFRLIMIEAILGLGVLACSAWMTQLPPPHQLLLETEQSHSH
jgi:putative copper resistance protein D